MSVNPKNVNPLNCDAVSSACPVEGSIYGYYPSLPANTFFAAFFGICLFINLGLGWRFRTWTYQVAMCLGCFSSLLGYIGRCLLHNNPYGTVGFEIQICCLTLAPAFNSAALYLILKHYVIQLGREWSRVRPKYYTWAFIIADLLALTLQGAGGGIAATSGDNESSRNVGDRLMLTGISWQVLTLLLFFSATTDYTIRRVKSSQPLSPSAFKLVHDAKFRIFLGAQAIAFICIFTRCVYRIAEMAKGWQSPIMQNQGLFIALDGCMVTVATLLQTFIHPGWFFPPLGTYRESKKAAKDAREMSSGEVSTEESISEDYGKVEVDRHMVV